MTGIGGEQVRTTGGDLPVDTLVNCAGLHADRIARLAGARPTVRIVPFRGEYFTIGRPELVRGLIYPVPDPDLPFLGVHLTRTVDGHLHAGPNAVLALAREGYRWRRVNVRDIVDDRRVPGHLAARPSPPRYRRRRGAPVAVPPPVRGQPCPAGTGRDPDGPGPAPAGVRAQAVGRDGALLDDFLLLRARAAAARAQRAVTGRDERPGDRPADRR